MKTEAIVIAALAGLAYWYFTTQTAQAKTAPAIKLPFDPGRSLEESNLLYARIVAARKQQQADAAIKTARYGSF